MANEPTLAHQNGAIPAADATRPFYQAIGNEEVVFKAAYRQGLSLLLKGPTGCGKTRFVEAMAHDLGRSLITVACHDDLTTADLVGRYLLRGGETVWVDGPLTRAVRDGAICYLDEVVEARQDDHRRAAPSLAGLPTSVADRTTRRDAGRGTRVRPGGVLQPRLPKRAEGPQGLHASANGCHRIRLSGARNRRGDRRARSRCGYRYSGRAWFDSAKRSAAWKPERTARGVASTPGAYRGRSADRRGACPMRRGGSRRRSPDPLTDDVAVKPQSQRG